MITFVDISPRIAGSVLDVAAAMQRREVIGVRRSDGYVVQGVPNQIQAEDGSGRNYNIKFSSQVEVFAIFA